MEGLDGGDDGGGVRVVLVDVVGGEEGFAVAGGVELVEPVACGIGGDRGDVFCAWARGGN